jgi:DNA-3-methyladenine glycosylase II
VWSVNFSADKALRVVFDYNESLMATNKTQLQNAVAHLSRHDPVLAPIIKRAGLAAISPHRNYYWALVDSIISQQLSVKAARTIEGRFQALFATELPEPAAILEKSIEELRSVGLSNAKAHYVRDLAQHIIDGRVRFDQLDQQSNETIITELTDVKGIGEWTAHMFLIFCMGRLDVLAPGDLGIRNGIHTLYKLADVPSSHEVRDIARINNWHPYESVACWYVWHSLDNKPAV